MTPERAREALFAAGLSACGWGVYTLYGAEWAAIMAGMVLISVSIVGSIRA